MENSPLAAKSRIQNMNFVKKITYGNLKFERRIHDFPDWEGAPTSGFGAKTCYLLKTA